MRIFKAIAYAYVAYIFFGSKVLISPHSGTFHTSLWRDATIFSIILIIFAMHEIYMYILERDEI